MKITINFIIKSNLFVALCATSLVWQTKLLLADDISEPFDYLLVFLSTLFIYNFHRLVKIRQRKNNPMVTDGNSSGTLNLTMSVISFLFLIPCFWHFDVWHWSIFFIGGIIALAYSFPVFSIKGIHYSLRTTPYAKLFIVVTVWALMTVLIPIRLPELERPEVLQVLLERLCFLLAITLPFDIRDMDLDKALGVTTIPLKYGWKKSLQLSYIFTGAFVVMVLLGYLSANHNLIETLMLVISAIITFLIIRKSRPDNPETHYAIFLEGTSLMQSLLIWVAYLMLSFI